MKVYKNIFVIILAMVVMTAMSVTYKKDYQLLQITYSDLTTEAKRQVDCLAQNIYWESAYEPEDGKIAVAMVTMNRVQDSRFPKDICGVVKQKTFWQGLTVCQFSWFCNAVTKPRDNYAYEQSMETALYVYANYDNLNDITHGAIYYHADYINPGWKLKKTTKIGRHIFYKDYYDDAKIEPRDKGRF